MKNIVQVCLFVATMLFVGTAFAFNVPTPTGYVTDTAGALKDSQVRILNKKLTDYQRTSKNEIAVLIVPSLGGENPEDVAQEVYQSYKIGKAGLDNGVLLLVAVHDHKMRLQTGKGVEGELTDIQSNDILASMKPFFRKGDFFGGVDTAVSQVESRLDERATQKADPGTGQQFNQPVAVQPDTNAVEAPASSHLGNDIGIGFGILALLIGAVFLVRYLVRRKVQSDMDTLESEVDAQIQFEKETNAREAEARTRSSAVKRPTVVPLVPRQPTIIPPKPPVAVVVPVAVPVQHDAAEAALIAAAAAREAAREAELRAQYRARQRAEERAEEAREQERRERRAEEIAAAAAAAALITAATVSRRRDDDDDNDDDNDDDSSSSSSSSFDWGSSDSGGGSDDSGFGGGDSGGGGSDDSW